MRGIYPLASSTQRLSSSIHHAPPSYALPFTICRTYHSSTHPCTHPSIHAPMHPSTYPPIHLSTYPPIQSIPYPRTPAEKPREATHHSISISTSLPPATTHVSISPSKSPVQSVSPVRSVRQNRRRDFRAQVSPSIRSDPIRRRARTPGREGCVQVSI